MPSWQEDFSRNFNEPHINRVTVGFSGIDPQQKIDRQTIHDEVIAVFNSLAFSIDSGEISNS